MVRKSFRAVVAGIIAAAIGIHAVGPIKPAHAYPHTVYQAEIDIQLAAVLASIRNQGFNFLISNVRGQMYGVGSRLTFYVNLQQGVQYRFEGRCDRDCRDLDLVLGDLGGRVLAGDRDDDDEPGFSFTAPYTGTFIVPFELAHCRAYRCQVGALIMARTTA
jgi:hypothetical protein